MQPALLLLPSAAGCLDSFSVLRVGEVPNLFAKDELVTIMEVSASMASQLEAPVLHVPKPFCKATWPMYDLDVAVPDELQVQPCTKQSPMKIH